MLLDRVRLFAQRHQLWRPQTRVIIALSGGADSVSLLLLLDTLSRAGDLVLDCAVHLNHRLRGTESDQDEEFCRALCLGREIAFRARVTDVRAAARRERVSTEVAARRARHAVFEEVLRARGADVVATAHTEDDQAETVLLRVLRGAGGRGLSGIWPRRRHLVRPLLGVSRQALRDWLKEQGQPWREDATNAEFITPRNRIRGELMPYLAAHFNPSVTRGLARLADLAREEDAALDLLISQNAALTIRCTENVVTLTVTTFANLPRGFGRRLARRALETAHPGRYFTVSEVDRLLEVVAGDKRVAEISGLRVERFRDPEVLIKKAPVKRPRRRGLRA